MLQHLFWECTIKGFIDHALTFSLSLSLSPDQGKTQVGVWLIEDLHGVTKSVSELTQNALVYMSFYPLLDSIVSTNRQESMSHPSDGEGVSNFKYFAYTIYVLPNHTQQKITIIL